MGIAHPRPTSTDTPGRCSLRLHRRPHRRRHSVVLPAEGVALLLGVNVIGNSLAAAVVDSSENRREAKRGSRDTRHIRAAPATTVLQKETAQ